MIRLEVTVDRKVYPGSDAVTIEGLHFTAAPAELLVFVGPSGAGKSTLLNIVGGLDQDLDGEVHIDGHAVYLDGTASPRVGIMFQAPRLMPWLTVLDNLRLVLGDDASSLERARELIRQVELERYETAFPAQLSGGMQRRAAMARAFAVRPSLLLLDEPFVSLDAPTAGRLRRYFLALWTELRPTVLYVTHDLREALAVADRVLFLSSDPARVVLELPVTLPRPREPEDGDVGQLHDAVLRAHPDLLSGLAGTSE